MQGIADVNQSVAIILTTPKGSDPLRPTFAADLWQFIDYPMNSLLAAVVGEVTQALTMWEPRITIVSITAQPVIDNTIQSGAHLDVAVTWKLKLAANGGGTARRAPLNYASFNLYSVSGRRPRIVCSS